MAAAAASEADGLLTAPRATFADGPIVVMEPEVVAGVEPVAADADAVGGGEKPVGACCDMAPMRVVVVARRALALVVSLEVCP